MTWSAKDDTTVSWPESVRRLAATKGVSRMPHFSSRPSTPVVTRGSEGSVVSDGKVRFEAGIQPVEVVDTTGAGDLYAAGVLHGMANGMALAECGRLGSIAASAVIGHTGARPGQSLAQLA